MALECISNQSCRINDDCINSPWVWREIIFLERDKPRVPNIPFVFSRIRYVSTEYDKGTLIYSPWPLIILC
jgi:hypothetical protein